MDKQVHDSLLRMQVDQYMQEANDWLIRRKGRVGWSFSDVIELARLFALIDLEGKSE